MRISLFVIIFLLIAGCTKDRNIPNQQHQAVQQNERQESALQKPEPGPNQNQEDFGIGEEENSNGKSNIGKRNPESAGKAVKSLYTDGEIEKLAGEQLDKLKKEGTVLLLNVVPSGESHPRSKVFRKMGIDEGRLIEGGQAGFNMVNILSWQASPSYDLSFMTATNDPANENLSLLDPRRKVYGVRIEKHHIPLLEGPAQP